MSSGIGYRQEPHNRKERHRAEAEQQQESERPDYEVYKEPAASKEKLHEKLVGKPVGSEVPSPHNGHLQSSATCLS